MSLRASVPSCTTRNASTRTTAPRAVHSAPVGCPAVPATTTSRTSCSLRRRLRRPTTTTSSPLGIALSPSSSRSLSPVRAVRADAPTETLDPVTVDAIASVTTAANEAHAAALAKAKEAAAAWAPAAADAPSSLRAKVLNSVADVQQGLLEREVEVRLMLLAALAGEHLLLLGPPGTAKSELSRRMAKLVGGTYFERLLTRFSVPEELFGPLSMRGLENDEYVRQTNGYLPTAEVAFVDEIFKANSAILNALLTLLNERLFDNGHSRLKVPLLTLIAASNELPESEELDALYDRFLIRRHVGQVSTQALGRLAMLAAGQQQQSENAGGAGGEAAASSGAPSSSPSPELTLDDFKSAASEAYAATTLPESVIDLLVSLRTHLQDRCEPPVYVSDRRFMKAVNLLQVAAFADARAAVNEYDCLLLEHVFGQRPDDSRKVRDFVLETIGSDPGLTQAELVLLALYGRAARALGAASDDSSNSSAASAPIEDAQEAKEAASDAADLVELLRLRHEDLSCTLANNFPSLRETVWQSAGSARAAAQALGPALEENKSRSADLLREALILEQALRCGKRGVLERVLPKRAKQYAKGVSERA